MEASAVVLFDGMCNFCDGAVQFMIANDPRGYFRFSSLQSDAGRAMIRDAGRNPDAVNSIVLIDRDGFHDRSEAALRIAKSLRTPWQVLWLFRVIPVSIRDIVYDVIARNRYRCSAAASHARFRRPMCGRASCERSVAH